MYFGQLHSKIRKDAKAMIVHGIIPNIKHGGKVKSNIKKMFEDYVGTTANETRGKSFVPTRPKSKKVKYQMNESFAGSSEMWDSQRLKGRSRDNYIKGKPNMKSKSACS